MDFTKNVDKLKNWPFDVALYNTVLDVQVSSEGSEPVLIADAKLWCKIDDDVDDDIVTALITAARIVCEQFTNIGFIRRTIVASINNADGGFNLPYGPVVTTPTAKDVDGNDVTLVYNMGQIQSPYGNMIITYTAGYATLPENLKIAIKQQILFMYDNRGEGVIGLSPLAQMILAPLRKVS